MLRVSLPPILRGSVHRGDTITDLGLSLVVRIALSEYDNFSAETTSIFSMGDSSERRRENVRLTSAHEIECLGVVPRR